MSAFELFFSLFGLILGLAVAVVITGLSNVFRERAPVRIGWLTPMLALFVLFDLTTLWVNAYNSLSKIEVAYAPFFGAMVVAGLYFFAANMVFPRTLNDWPSLDDYYMHRARFVLGGVFLANVGVAIMGLAASRDWRVFTNAFARTEVTVLWWVTLLVMLLVMRRRVQLVGLAIMLLIAVYALVMFWRPLA